MSSQKTDYNNLYCSLCHNEIPPGSLFKFMQCEICGDIIHDACHQWLAPKIIENQNEITELWIPFCHICGDNIYRIITPGLWKTPTGEIIESSTMWKDDWNKYL